MALVRPFHALRPEPNAAAAVAAVPYDVVSTAEARALAAGNPLSFLRVSRAEIDLTDDVPVYDDLVYKTAADNLESLRADAPLVVEDPAALYFYRLRDGAHQQTGLAGCFSLDEYERGVIKKHERTRPDKEDDRTRHMLAVGAQTGIVFLTYRAANEVTTIMERACRGTPLFDFSAPDGVQHMVWRLALADQEAVVEAFEKVPSLYIADGHHRIASAARARRELAEANHHDPAAEACHVLGVAFPDSETRILPYNRAVTSLSGLTPPAFLAQLESRFTVEADADPVPAKGRAGMYVGQRWYAISLDGDPLHGDGVAASLDVAVLQDQILEPLLQIADVRTDPRMLFVGGSRGTGELERLVDSGEAAVAFSMAAVTPDELLRVSDAGEMMPPKSTWFEPKLRDGLLVHLI